MATWTAVQPLRSIVPPIHPKVPVMRTVVSLPDHLHGGAAAGLDLGGSPRRWSPRGDGARADRPGLDGVRMVARRLRPGRARPGPAPIGAGPGGRRGSLPQGQAKKAHGSCLGPHDEGAIEPGPGRRAAAGGQAAVELLLGRAAVGLGLGQVGGGALAGVVGRGLGAAGAEPAGDEFLGRGLDVGCRLGRRLGPVGLLLGVIVRMPARGGSRAGSPVIGAGAFPPTRAPRSCAGS